MLRNSGIKAAPSPAVTKGQIHVLGAAESEEELSALSCSPEFGVLSHTLYEINVTICVFAHHLDCVPL